VLVDLREAFGSSVMVENDIDVAALAERAHGHGRDVDSFAFISIGTGLGMGLVLGGKLHRGAHGAAGEIGYMPFSEGHGADIEDAQLRGSFEAASTAAAVVRAATRAGVVDASSAQQVFSAAAHGDSAAAAVVAEEALLVAKAVCAVITVVDPDLVVLGGGIGQAPGFMEAVQANLATMAPVLPTVKTSALGADAVVDGCVAAGLDRAWELVIASIPAPPSE
jgi:predicted NBD/HSP70 family sugar kinase